MSGIRPTVHCLLEHEGRLLLQEGQYVFAEEMYYRAPGGGIEYGERSEEAVRREIMEELGAEIGTPELLHVVENIFEYAGALKHELVFVYRARLVDQRFTEMEVVPMNDNGLDMRAVWVPIESIVSGEKIMYPVEVRQRLTSFFPSH